MSNVTQYTDKNHDLHELEKYRFIHHFIPHEHHRTRAKLLSHKAFLMYSLLALLVFGLFNLIPYVMPGVLGYASDISIPDLLTYTNNVRAQHGLEPLRLNSSLTNAAERKASDMFEFNYWAHVSPNGTEPWAFILGENYDYAYAGENLAKNFNTSKDVVDAWFQSPSHRDNLLSANYDEIGFAVSNGVLQGYETTLVVQMFGRPRNAGAIASIDEERVLLESLEPAQAVAVVPPPSVETVFNESGESAPVPAPGIATETLPALDVSLASRTLGLIFGGFLLTLFAVDIWYTKKKSIPKFTGHTFAHMVFLIVIMVTIVFVIKPGSIL